MAIATTTEAFPVIKPEMGMIISARAWEAAHTLYKPIERQWHDEFDAADMMPDGPDREKAFDQFYKVNLPRFMRAREAFMAVPAPGLCELLIKMEFADASDDEHHDLIKCDLRRIIANSEKKAG